jgi:homoserine kinase type II
LAIYIAITDDDLRSILHAWDVPPLQAALGIPEGSINTNVALEFKDGSRAFLRLTMVRDEAALNYEAALLEALAGSGVEAARLRRTRSGAVSVPWGGGFVSLFDWIDGVEVARKALESARLRSLGGALARMHGALDGITTPRPNAYDTHVVAGWLEELRREDHPGLEGLADFLLEAQETARGCLVRHGSSLPAGPIHADLFMDNVKWPTPDAPVLFDFEMACHSPRVLDVAITLDAWCFDGEFQQPLARAFVEGYESVRPLTAEEWDALHGAALCGAIRFTTSRIRDFHLSMLPPDRLAKKDYRTWLARVNALRSMGKDRFREWLAPRG